jgi:drug/metabolite transporter (DMT)-like permease
VSGDPRDRTAYGIAIASLGLALAVVLVGICWIAIEEKSTPGGMWITAAALGGILVGVLLPFSLRLKPTASPEPNCGIGRWPWAAAFGLVFVGCLCVTALIFGRTHHNSLALYAIASALGGVLIGLPIPSPARGE